MSPKRTIEPFLKIKIKLQWMKEELGQAGGPAEECWGLLTKMECRISFSAPPPPHRTEHHHIFILLRRR